MRILVCGDREWRDKEKIKEKIYSLGLQHRFQIIHGAATGADTLAGEVGREMGKQNEVIAFPAPWSGIPGLPESAFRYRKDGKRYWPGAGPYRNQQMLDEGKPDLVLAFHSDIGKSKGTMDMIKRANKAGIEVRLYG